ncbi:MAG TPA: AraC family transcriptional regulator [Abditibacteriaceae bacterium]
MSTRFLPTDALLHQPDVHRILRLDDEWRFITAGLRFYDASYGADPIKSSEHHYGTNLVLRGRGTYTDEEGHEHALLPGCFFQRLPSRPHSTRFDVKSSYAECFVSLDLQTGSRLMQLRLIEPILVADAGLNQLALDEFLGLLNVLKTSESEIASPTVLIHILNFLNGLYERARHTQDDRSSALVRAACVLLEQNLEQRISMGEIARRLEVSPPTLRRVFRRIMGLSPGEYRIRRRIERARALLMSYSVKEVAARLGYNDAFTFSAQFKTVMKTSPRDFRKNLTCHQTLPFDTRTTRCPM